MEELIDELLEEMDYSYYNRDFRDQYLIDLLSNVLGEVSKINRDILQFNVDQEVLNKMPTSMLKELKAIKLLENIDKANRKLDYYIEKADSINRILEEHDIEVELYIEEDKIKLSIEE
ncbi:hypothetical protein GOQ27_15100 [Clostridium sp. D2Q-11]|uniref:Uncharacterized protein n=1 Tax=Anaeromonas frigoriresistens TaxID=2683708 RepID=A0A942UY94_9FIRM|nr:hypothetical protein [Anaeromonas frigoriresistens]MBS4539800.1 hypothetical protein [Anaeromonas frigoriresistens]